MTLATFGRWAYLLVAIAAWVGVVFTLVITGVDGYSREAVARPGMLGGAPFGWAGFGQRMIECLSYFTEWSNILVAIVATLIVWKGPDIGSWGRALQLCALMMITVTAIVYHFLIRPTEVLSGWSVFTNPLQHVVVPALMILAALLCGPRGGLDVSVVLKALVIPVIWVVYTLIRGAFVHQYPYDFVNVSVLGYQQVLINIVAILCGALVFLALIAGIDWGVGKGLPARN